MKSVIRFLMLAALSLLITPLHSYAAPGGDKGPDDQAWENASDNASFKRDENNKDKQGKKKKQKNKDMNKNKETKKDQSDKSGKKH